MDATTPGPLVHPLVKSAYSYAHGSRYKSRPVMTTGHTGVGSERGTRCEQLAPAGAEPSALPSSWGLRGFAGQPAEAHRKGRLYLSSYSPLSEVWHINT